MWPHNVTCRGKRAPPPQACVYYVIEEGERGSRNTEANRPVNATPIVRIAGTTDEEFWHLQSPTCSEVQIADPHHC